MGARTSYFNNPDRQLPIDTSKPWLKRDEYILNKPAYTVVMVFSFIILLLGYALAHEGLKLAKDYRDSESDVSMLLKRINKLHSNFDDNRELAIGLSFQKKPNLKENQRVVEWEEKINYEWLLNNAREMKARQVKKRLERKMMRFPRVKNKVFK